MCIVFWKLQREPTDGFPYKFVFAGNRDEFFNRPAQLSGIWKNDGSKILSPIDLEPPEDKRGTWIGMNESGKISFLTNYHEKNFKTPDKKSRGLLVRDYITKNITNSNNSNSKNENSAENSLNAENASIAQTAPETAPNDQPAIEFSQQSLVKDYDGFNLIQIDLKTMSGAYITNRNEDDWYVELSDSELYGLSNSQLNTWPKVEEGKRRIHEILNNTGTDHDQLANRLFEVLMTTQTPFSKSSPPTIDQFPTSIFIPMHGLTSAAKATKGNYGTRSSSVILVDNNNVAHFYEKIHEPEYQNILHHDESLTEPRKIVMDLDI